MNVLTRSAFFGCFQVFLLSAVCAQTLELRVARGNENYPPNEMRINGTLTGLHVEVVEAVAARIGMKVVWEELPWLRAQKCVEEKQCDAITYISPSPEREKWATFLPGNLLSRVEMHFMIHKDNAANMAYKGNVAEFLGNRTVTALNGFNYGPEITAGKRRDVKNLATLAGMVAGKQSELGIVAREDFHGMKDQAVYQQLQILEPPVWESKAYIAFSKAPKNTSIAEKFQAGYADFRKSKDYQSLLQRFKPAS